MASWVIVAIPSARDDVWRISSEKVPHMTLCYLGEQDDDLAAQRISLYLKHLAELTMQRFGMEVTRRGALGPDNADVLFFDKQESNAKKLEDIRSMLLKQQDIFEMYKSIEQYEEWTPHLTLGWPDRPAKKLKDDNPNWYPYWVDFDRVALWLADSEGPEFVLDESRYHDEAYQSAIQKGEDVAEDTLAHYGIKGMKWGVSRTRQQIDADSADVTRVKEARGKIKANRTTDVLSNKELQDVVTRLNLEQQYTRLTTPQNKELFKGQNFIKELTKTGKTVNDAVNTASSVHATLGPLLQAAASQTSKRASHSTGSITKKEARSRKKNPYGGTIGDM